MNKVFGLTVAFLTFQRILWGWGDLGHQAVGEIAERNLTPKARAMVFEIIGAEPLAISAFFADQVRSDKRFAAFANYHFFEVPEGADPGATAVAQAAKKSADTIICEAPKVIGRQGVPNSQKAILLKFLVHVVGDIHQPLHIGNGVDRGANLCQVNWTDPASGKIRETNLHSVWDESILDYAREDFKKQWAAQGKRPPFFGYPEIVELALKELDRQIAAGQLTLATATQVEPYQWYAESRQLHAQVYPDKVPGLKPEARPYCKRVDPGTGQVINGAFDAHKIPTLDEKYARKALKLAYQQIAIGGYRLARLLNELAEKAPASPAGPNAFTDVLDAVQLEKGNLK